MIIKKELFREIRKYLSYFHVWILKCGKKRELPSETLRDKYVAFAKLGLFNNVAQK